jgi:hypothetical protein
LPLITGGDIFRKPSPSTLIACLALFVALGGTAIAASRYVITSASQIKPSVLSALGATTPTGEVQISGPQVSIGPGKIGASEAECPRAGALVNSQFTSSKAYHLVTGGYNAGLGTGAYVLHDGPGGTSRWFVLISNVKSTEASTVQAIALCAPGPLRLAGAP